MKAFAMSRGTRTKTDRIDAELIARFMLFRPEAGRTLPSDNLRILRTLTTRRAQIVDMRKRLSMQIAARQKQGISADVEDMDDVLKALLNTWIGDIESRIESVTAQEKTTAVKANLLRSIPGIGPVSAAMLIAEMPELGRMTSRRGGGHCDMCCSKPHSPRISQPNAKARRTTPQGAWKTAQACHHRNRKRDPQNR
ncbi:MAG: transposase [Thalassospira sp.]|nr:transposase [Thalassospira sp.]MDP2698552.1 transposase [Thalassospira sp.]